MTIEMKDKRVTSLRFNVIKKKKKKKKRFMLVFNDFIFSRLAENAVSGSPSVT